MYCSCYVCIPSICCYKYIYYTYALKKFYVTWLNTLCFLKKSNIIAYKDQIILHQHELCTHTRIKYYIDSLIDKPLYSCLFCCLCTISKALADGSCLNCWTCPKLGGGDKWAVEIVGLHGSFFSTQGLPVSCFSFSIWHSIRTPSSV